MLKKKIFFIKCKKREGCVMANQRDFFRVRFHEKVMSVVNLEAERDYEVYIRDISGNGISFFLSKKVEMKKNTFLYVQFELEQRIFELTCSVVRIVEENGEFVYGCRFEGMKESEKANLSSLLFKIDAIRHKK